MVWCFDSYQDQQTVLRNIRTAGYGGPVAEYNKDNAGRPRHQLEFGLPWSAAYRWRLAFVTPERERLLRELVEQKCDLQNKVDNFDVNWEQQQMIVRDLRKENEALEAKINYYENKYGKEI
jgi:hypothetical protein